MSDTGALIYVVDSDVSARECGAGLVRPARLTANTFASREEFLAAPRPRPPSCLVSDLNLPGVSGLDLQRELIKSEVQVPIIFLTRHGETLTNGGVLQVPMTELIGKAGPTPLNGRLSAEPPNSERARILKALEEAKGQVGGPDGAAARLGVKRTTLQSRMRKLNISRQFR